MRPVQKNLGPVQKKLRPVQKLIPVQKLRPVQKNRDLLKNDLFTQKIEKGKKCRVSTGQIVEIFLFFFPE
jgi:hypothetical protein